MALIDKLLENIDNPNLAVKLDEDTTNKIASLVKTGYDIDLASRKDWEDQTKEGLKIAEQVMEKKDFPWPNASNVKFPLIAISAIQFAARAMPAIIQGDKVVKAKVVGKDLEGLKEEKAVRVSNHMSWQLTEQMEGWEDDTDKLLHVLPVVGTVFRKTYYDSLTKTNVSELCMPLDVVVHMKTKNFARCRRTTHKVWLYKNEVIERELYGIFVNKGADYFQEDTEEDLAELFIEQHRWYDLDKDGYEEPYIVTVHEASATLVRMVANYDAENIQVNRKGKISKITPVQYFTPYFFIPSASGKFYAMGFAHLLGGINEALSTSINQLIDAGTLATLGGGFLGRGARMGRGKLTFAPGEWKEIQVTGGMLKDNIVPLPVRDPSNVLFQLLGTLNEQGQKLSSVSDTMSGETPSQNTPATTTLAVIEQGMMVFSAINLRVFRALTSEYKKLRRLNYLYLDEEQAFRVLDDKEHIAYRRDYAPNDYDVYPVANPSMSSSAHRLAKARALLETVDQVPTPQGKLEILWRYYEALQIENIDKILTKDEQGQFAVPEPPPDPKLVDTQIKAVESQVGNDIKWQMLPLEKEKLESEIDQIKALTKKALADAESQPIMNQLQALNDMVKAIQADTKLEVEKKKMEVSSSGQGNNSGSKPGGSPGMDAAPDNSQAPEVPGGLGGGLEGAVDGGNEPEPPEYGGDGAIDDVSAGTDPGTQPYPPNIERS